ncbi:MAG: LON peptidase substrate-binding domain-containing protein [Pseudomonadota bacterium]|nr:LON peptidase substrate-binding domain-containing protein [Pseudomonadota bacterium]
MFPFLRATSQAPTTLPLFPLKTVLFPGRVLPLKVFEQRYIDMSKTCLKDELPFGVCLITRGEEVIQRGAQNVRPDAKASVAFAHIGTQARIASWDMPQLGILHLKTEGGTRFQVQSSSVADDGLVVARVTPLPPEPALELPEAFAPLVKLLELMITRAGRENFSAELALNDASWVGYRLAELLPLPLPIKQSMLEINDSVVRLKVLAEFLKKQGLA